KRVFTSIAVFACLVSLLAAYSIFMGSFYLLCSSFLLLGISVSSVNQFRFAAMESVDAGSMPQAASSVLLGGIVAAFLGPELADQGRYLFPTEFVGSFIL